jgi:hypothetical protein
MVFGIDLADLLREQTFDIAICFVPAPAGGSLYGGGVLRAASDDKDGREINNSFFNIDS